MDIYTTLRAIAALGIVLAMIWAAMWLLRRYGGQFVSTPGAQKTRQMSVLETLNLPPRHKLLRVANGTREHLILLGPDGTRELTGGTPMPDAPALDQENGDA